MANDLKQVIAKVAGEGQAKDKKPEELIQLVVFKLDREEYAAQITDLQEIIKIPEITPIPNTPRFIRGILNLRGKIVVVVDLEKRFNLTRESKDTPQHIVIAEVGGNIFGVIVDEVTEVLRIPVTAIQPPPALVSSKIHADYLKGVAVLEIKEPSKESLEKACRRLATNHQIKNSAEKAETRLLILLDLPKMLEDKELLQVGESIQRIE